MSPKTGLLTLGLIALGSLPLASAGDAEPAPSAGQTHVPNFVSGGLRVSVTSVSVSPDKKRVTVTAVVTNEGQQDLRASIIGAVGGVDDLGGSMEADKVYGFAYCNHGQYSMKDCVAEPQKRDYPEYTEIDKGSSATIPIAFAISNGILKGKTISFSMTIAVVPVVSPDKSGEIMVPRARIISLGLPLIPIPQGTD